MDKCVQCGAELAAGQAVCSNCGHVVSAPVHRPAPDPAAAYPLRVFDVRLEELIGWPEERVLAALGRPNTDEEGSYWRSPDPAVPGSLWRNQDGKIIRTHVFGPVPGRVPAGTPYRRWTYHNVRGMTWVLYLSRPAVSDAGQAQDATSSPAQAEQPEARAGLARLFGGDHRQRRARERVVVEVTQYPTGAVF